MAAKSISKHETKTIGYSNVLPAVNLDVMYAKYNVSKEPTDENDTSESNSQCGICGDNYKLKPAGVPVSSEYAHKLKCGHVYHLGCITQWLVNGSGSASYTYGVVAKTKTCPYCRCKAGWLPLVLGQKPVRGVHAEYKKPISKKKVKYGYASTKSITNNIYSNQCKAITKKGHQCGNYGYNNGYCGIKSHKKQGTTGTGLLGPPFHSM